MQIRIRNTGSNGTRTRYGTVQTLIDYSSVADPNKTISYFFLFVNFKNH